MKKLLVAVMGFQNSGKSQTWEKLFDQTPVRTGKHRRNVWLSEEEYVMAFLINGSPEERKIRVEDILDGRLPEIVLASIQYDEHGYDTLDHFINNGYEIYLHWLNPGYHSSSDRPHHDYLGFVNYQLYKGATIRMVNGKDSATERVQAIKNYLYGWAKYQNLIVKEEKNKS